MSIVVIARTEKGLGAAIDEVFAPHGGVKNVIPSDVGSIYVKSNGVHLSRTLTQTPSFWRPCWAICAITTIGGWR